MKLLFVYNADSDFSSLVGDVVRKLVAPNTCQCNLCCLTYPLFSMNREWKKFIGSLPHETLFLHRDEFRKQWPDQKSIPLPAVFTESASGIRLFISKDQINKAKSVADLMGLVKNALVKIN